MYSTCLMSELFDWCLQNKSLVLLLSINDLYRVVVSLLSTFFPTDMYLNVMCVCDYLCCERMKAGRGRNEHANCSRTLINPRSLHTSGLWGPPHGHWLLGNICFRDSRLSAKQVCSKSWILPPFFLFSFIGRRCLAMESNGVPQLELATVWGFNGEYPPMRTLTRGTLANVCLRWVKIQNGAEDVEAISSDVAHWSDSPYWR